MVKKKGLYVITHGCQMNMYDSIRIKESLAEEYRMVDAPGEADLILINTCSVREKPQIKVIAELENLRPLQKRNPKLMFAVAGCVAQQEKAKLLERIPFLDLVVGPDKIAFLPEILRNMRPGERKVETGFIKGGFHLQDYAPLDTFGKAGNVSAFIAVQKGCNKFCSYCIVPHVRGREKSRPHQEIINEITRYANAGVVEVTLLGQNITAYGEDLKDCDFADLLYKVAEIDGIERIRFVTSHPADMNDRHIEAMANIDKVCNYLHLPIQSGSNRILELMNRGYTREQYLDLMERFKANVPNLAISCDIIVGFPGETEKDFEQTMDIIERIEYDTLFSFIYSARPGTKAARLEDPIERSQKQKWLDILQNRQKYFTRKANEKLVGTTQKILVESLSKRSKNDLAGRTESNKLVNFSADSSLIGKFASVKIITAYQHSLRGELVK